ncbi:hypothetical protein [Luteibacter sp.]|jgi:hypothetical protein|uniref:hypothetical protein n=1 Tax=Luteibacter sp. TaxID=1886636 RepID=UPI002F3EF452
MATPHPALDVAVQQFAHEPGVAPADVAALQAALTSDPDLTQRLDGAAASGALHGFAPTPPGTPNAPIGTYDPASHTVTLSLNTKSKHPMQICWDDDSRDGNEKMVYPTI